MARFLENKLGWAKMLAAKKNVKLTVQSNTNLIASELALLNCQATPMTAVSRQISSPATASFCTSDERDVEMGDTLTSPPPHFRSSTTFQDNENIYLHIDPYKVEQVIRNLITNAVRKALLTLFK